MISFDRKNMVLLRELFSPFGRRQRLRFLMIDIACLFLLSLFKVLVRSDTISFSPSFFLFLTFILAWIFLVNAIKRIRDMRFGLVPFCFSKWAIFFLFSWSLCLYVVPSLDSEKYEKT